MEKSTGGRSAPVSGGQWKPRAKNPREEHSGAPNRTRGEPPPAVRAASCDRYLTRACWSLEGDRPRSDGEVNQVAPRIAAIRPECSGDSCVFIFPDGKAISIRRCLLCVRLWVLRKRTSRGRSFSPSLRARNPGGRICPALWKPQQGGSASTGWPSWA